MSEEEKESADQRKERESELHDQYCCTMSVVWDALSKYGQTFRQYVADNGQLMALIQDEWAKDSDLVLANQAHSLLAALTNDDAFELLFSSKAVDDAKDGDQETEAKVLCPCGDVLELRPAKDCYEKSSYTFLYCDYCREKVDWGMDPMRMVYHCDKKENAHPHGFDLCVVCAKRKLVIDSHPEPKNLHM